MWIFTRNSSGSSADVATSEVNPTKFSVRLRVMRTATHKNSTSEILKMRLHRSSNHSKDHRCRNAEHQCLICCFKGSQQSPRWRHYHIALT